MTVAFRVNRLRQASSGSVTPSQGDGGSDPAQPPLGRSKAALDPCTCERATAAGLQGKWLAVWTA
ncbi:hypothetical protein GCM10023090_04030 [Acidovorax lacteus]|uniref:Uncharacterized protein n=1 Tax=Acidovorax lacteus TaxID=1924988 RepID=A0ABP8KZE5_9BURK